MSVFQDRGLIMTQITHKDGILAFALCPRGHQSTDGKNTRHRRGGGEGGVGGRGNFSTPSSPFCTGNGAATSSLPPHQTCGSLSVVQPEVVLTNRAPHIRNLAG